MDTLPIVLVLAALIVALGAIIVAARGRAGAGDPALAGKIDLLAQQAVATQGAIGERLQAQERMLAELLNERLAAVSQRVGEDLAKGVEKTTATLGQVHERLAVIDAAQANIAQLSNHVVDLRNILGNKQARGAFGQQQMEDLVRNLMPPAAYRLQATVGGKLADCLMLLPNPPGSICIDSKFPLESYRALVAAGDAAQHETALRNFATDVRKHVNDIAEKYIVPGETAEGAIMFVPSEAIYAEIHSSLPELVGRANQLRVSIVSPSTLWALLHTMRAVLKDVRMHEQTGLIQKEVGRLLEDIRLIDERVGSLETHFRQASEDIGKIRVSAEKLTRKATLIRDAELPDAGA